VPVVLFPLPFWSQENDNKQHYCGRSPDVSKGIWRLWGREHKWGKISKEITKMIYNHGQPSSARRRNETCVSYTRFWEGAEKETKQLLSSSRLLGVSQQCSWSLQAAFQQQCLGLNDNSPLTGIPPTEVKEPLFRLSTFLASGD